MALEAGTRCQATPAAARRGFREDALCASLANTSVRFSARDVPVCRIHEATYARWGGDAEERARSLWRWQVAASAHTEHVRVFRSAGATRERAGDRSLGRRHRCRRVGGLACALAEPHARNVALLSRDPEVPGVLLADVPCMLARPDGIPGRCGARERTNGWDLVSRTSRAANQREIEPTPTRPSTRADGVAPSFRLRVIAMPLETHNPNNVARRADMPSSAAPR
jgi:hypothetical protein